MDKVQLGSTKEDRIAGILKSIVGLVPGGGSALAEIVGCIIPNQRIDRIEKYLILLSKELDKIEKEKLKNAINDEECVGLMEESFAQATFSITSDRRRYIAKIVKNGINADDISYLESKYVMKLMGELNDQEIIWLRFFLVPTMGEDEDFRNKNKTILDPIHVYIGADERTIERSALQKNYKNHLERLGLIRSNIKINKSTNLPEYDSLTGNPKVSYRNITPLGRLLLKQIELYEDKE